MIVRMKELKSENARLKNMYIEERLKAKIFTETLTKSDGAVIRPYLTYLLLGSVKLRGMSQPVHLNS